MFFWRGPGFAWQSCFSWRKTWIRGVRTFPLLFYVAEYFVNHAKFENVESKIERDRTPFQAATVKGHRDVMQLLLEYGAERE